MRNESGVFTKGPVPLEEEIPENVLLVSFYHVRPQ